MVTQIFEGGPGLSVNTFIHLKNEKQCVSLPKSVCFHLTESDLHP